MLIVLQPGTRLELLPYVASSSRMTGNRDRNNPFDDGVNLGGRVGADMKVGIGSNGTSIATSECGRRSTATTFSLADRTTLSTQFRFNYTFKPDVTLDVYAEPFAASGRYNGLGELAVARGRDLRLFGTDGTTLERLPDGSYRVTDGAAAFTLANRDFNVRSFRSNVVLRWEWRPGSTLFVVWQQNRSSSEAYGDHVGPGDLFGSFSAPGDNILAVKTAWWISR